jgi:hypothetical protein
MGGLECFKIELNDGLCEYGDDILVYINFIALTILV